MSPSLAMAITHCWAADTLYDHIAEGLQWEPLLHTAGSGFEQAGVRAGERVYVLATGMEEDPWQPDDIVLVGRFVALGRAELTSAAADDSAVVTQLEAEEHLDVDDLWRAREHVLAVEGTGSEMDARRVLPADVLAAAGLAAGELDGVRRLTDEQAQALEACLEQSDEVAAPRRAADRLQALEEDGRAIYAVLEHAGLEEPDGLNDALGRAQAAASRMIAAQSIVPVVPSLPPATDAELAELAAEEDPDEAPYDLSELVDSLFGWAITLAQDAGWTDEDVDRLVDEDAEPRTPVEQAFIDLVAAVGDAQDALDPLLPADDDEQL